MLLSFLEAQQVSIAELSAAVELEPDVLMADEGMPLNAYLKLQEWAAERFHTPHLGLKLAQKCRAHDFGIAGFLFTSAATFGEFFKLLEHYLPIVMKGSAFQFIDHGELSEVRYTIETVNIE